MKIAACVIVKGEEGKILSVSRKDNPNDWGLPGGKCEPNENPENAAIRETLEETGYSIDIYTTDYFVDICGEYEVYTYIATDDYMCNFMEVEEEGLVDFKTYEELESGSFSEYNKKCFDYFLELGLL